MKARGLLLVSLGILIALGLHEGGIISNQEMDSRSEQLREILAYKRKIDRIRHKPNSHQLYKIKLTRDVAPECWAQSEGEAREKLLNLVLQQERLSTSETVEDATSQINQYPEQMNRVMCEDGVPEQEKLAIAAELSSRYKWDLFLSTQRTPKDTELSIEAEHQIVKKHLGEQRYLDQIIKCHFASNRKAAQQWALGVEYLSSILGLSEGQRVDVQDILTKRQASQYGLTSAPASPISVLDEAGHMVAVTLDGSGPASLSDETATYSEADQTRHESELSERFFSLLTPEQKKRYQIFLEDQGGSLLQLLMLTFENPEKHKEIGQQVGNTN